MQSVIDWCSPQLQIVHQHGDVQVFTWLVNKRRQTVLQGFIRLFVLGKNYRVLFGTRLRAFHIHLRSSFVATRFLKHIWHVSINTSHVIVKFHINFKKKGKPSYEKEDFDVKC